MGFIESLLGSGLANAIALKATADAFNEESRRLHTYIRPESTARSVIQKELFERALKAIKRKNYTTAIPLLIRTIKLDPYYPPYYFQLGCCYCYIGQFDNALECYDKALDVDGEDKVYVMTDVWRKNVRECLKICEIELNKNTPIKQGPLETKNNIINKPTIKRIRPTLKRNTKKTNNPGSHA